MKLSRFTLTTRPFDNGMPGQFVILDCDTQLVVAKCKSQVEEKAWEEVKEYNSQYTPKLNGDMAQQFNEEYPDDEPDYNYEG
jgi:hypothetical protein